MLSTQITEIISGIAVAATKESATALFQKVSGYLGSQNESIRLISEAKTEREIATIEADTARVKGLSEIEQHTLRSLLNQEKPKTENKNQIVAQAIQELPPDAKVENIQKTDEDWLAYFFKHCDTVSDKEMQSLWAKILANEAAKPNTFSKRTLFLVSTLDKKDAELFTTFCQFVWLSDDEYFPLIYNYQESIYSTKGINFDQLAHLKSIGLISTNIGNLSPGYGMEYPTPNTELRYHDNFVTIQLKKQNKIENLNDYYVNVGNALLTKVGMELASISGAKKNDEFFKYAINRWQEEGINPVVSKQTQLPNTATE